MPRRDTNGSEEKEGSPRAWLRWLLAQKERLTFSERRPAIARLAELATQLELDIPRSELELAAETCAFHMRRPIVDGGVAAFDSPACDWEDLELRPLGTVRGTGSWPGRVEGDWQIRVGTSELRGVALSVAGELPVVIGTPDLPGGWRWLVLWDRGLDEPDAWLGPLGSTIADLVLLHSSGLSRPLVEGDDGSIARVVAELQSGWLAPTERELVGHCLARLSEAARAVSGCDDITVRSRAKARAKGRSLAKGSALLLERIARLEAALQAPAIDAAAPSRAAWPDQDIEDEDALAESIVATYSPKRWTERELRRLLARGGRQRKAPPRKWPRGTPKLLRVFLSERAGEQRGIAVSDGAIVSHDAASFPGPLFEVFSVGNGDAWICTQGDASTAMYFDHEDVFDGSQSVPLGSLLAAWLFHDEVVARGLSDHPDIEAHARALCPVRTSSVFVDLDL